MYQSRYIHATPGQFADNFGTVSPFSDISFLTSCRLVPLLSLGSPLGLFDIVVLYMGSLKFDKFRYDQPRWPCIDIYLFPF